MSQAAAASSSSFTQQLEDRVKDIDSLLCIGLDPHPQDLVNVEGSDDAEKALLFCTNLITATLPYAACYKPNAAFFEALPGGKGHEILKAVIAHIHQQSNHKIPVLLDVKRGDIGSTATAYAQAAYDGLGADAVTLSPLMGWDSVEPFVTKSYQTKGAFLLCKTSNPGSNDFLALNMSTGSTLFEHIAKKVGHEWNIRAQNQLGLVVGATDTVALQKARQTAGEKVWILAPGVGAQGGDLAEACQAGCNASGTGLLVPVSRGISRAEDPAKAAEELRDAIRKAVQQVIQTQTAATSTTTASLQPYQKEFIEFSLQQGVLKFGSFVLKSGRTSPYFFNAGLFCSGQSLYQLGMAYASAIMDSPKLTTTDPVTKQKTVNFDVMFGPAYKGISLGAVVSSALYAQYGVSVGFAYNRKEAKDHGEGGVLVGADMAQKRVLVVDDVITAGTAIRESHILLVEPPLQATVVGVVIALDRAEKRSLEDPVSAVQAVARDLNMPVVSIVNLPQLQTFLKNSQKYGDDILQSVSEYRAKYGVEDGE